MEVVWGGGGKRVNFLILNRPDITVMVDWA